ncbi:Na(+)/H(+) antiporter subunit B [Leptolyngbya sp. CCNP1308]|uniref:Na(+)/H(+) antiporter subunit B n=1 Tax=Leptolyngbya sp. CCNP1308 TaxID=3110255 RepID=UPI002B202D0D|nr:Na(+)/H(+) antiporter subunit B [Leptolyngbya sp. CCNP1308]MEA5451648.1 Na(+)/H(+) antiporter subunit B [Leptolyngbya sp. CCNP1308]
MKWVYLAAGLLLFVKMLILPDPVAGAEVDIAGAIVAESNVPNAVSGIIFRNRLYDTIFEVVVFTIAIMGAKYLLADETPTASFYSFDDEPSIVLARLGATIAALVGIELAIRGHLSPGGGFAAGVAGGTAIGLIAITAPSPEWMQAIYERWHAATWEKVSVLVFIALAVFTLVGVELPPGQFGTLLSGGIIPVMNILVALKVALGSWAITLLFIRYRGLL